MRLVRTEKQKDNAAKFVWDMAKVAMTLFVIGPFANSERVGVPRLVVGLGLALVLVGAAYMIDGKNVRQ